jgi:hypothetical protein
LSTIFQKTKSIIQPKFQKSKPIIQHKFQKSKPIIGCKIQKSKPEIHLSQSTTAEHASGWLIFIGSYVILILWPIAIGGYVLPNAIGGNVILPIIIGGYSTSPHF